MGISVIVIANDFLAVNVALPTMESDFDTNINTIQWVVSLLVALDQVDDWGSPWSRAR